MLEFFSEALDWPIDADDLEDATFEYTPEELGVDGSRVKDLTSLRQLRPLVQGQPWGIFFVEFAGDRLPVVQLRRLLQRLVERKRRSARDQKTWALDDLLFIVLTGTGVSVELHLVAFSDEGAGVPTIRTLEWRPGDTPTRRLTRLADELLPRLGWPSDVSSVSAWTEQWHDAFRLRHGEAIRDARRLAERMSGVAVDMRHEVRAALDEEGGSGSLSDLLVEFKSELSESATADTFSDIAAQTLVYGLLTNRIADPDAFGASPTLAAIPLANAFLEEFFERVLTHVEASAAAEDSLEQLVADLRVTNVEAILDEFGGTLKGGDPVIHLYEQFLKEYDPVQRADSGAFYTPLPVVRFMIRSVDQTLREHFQLELGIADPSTWGEVAERCGFPVPDGVDPGERFINVVDPAAGTGTFLVEWIECAREAFLAARPSGDWPAHMARMVLPSLHGFELNPAAFAIAHVKIALECHTHGVEPPGDLLVLTNTLEHPAPQQALLPPDDPIAAQGQLAAHLKTDVHFSVVIGNPPYDREARAVDDGSARKGGVVRHGVPGVPPLISHAIDPLRVAGLGKHAKNVYNDYIYFWLWGAWQALEDPPRPGVVALITGSSWLEGVSFGGLRHYLREQCDELTVLDLAGDGRAGAPDDENVFDIRTPVSIAIAVRTGTPETTTAVNYARIEGPRASKFQRLDDWLPDAYAVRVDDLPGVESMRPPQDHPAGEWPSLTDLFPWSHSGAQFKRIWPISPDKETLKKRWEALVSAPIDGRPALLRETRDRKVTTATTGLLDSSAALRPLAELKTGDLPEGIVPYGYRSFDTQWAIADKRVADFPRPDLWAARVPGQIFFASLTSTPLGPGPAMTCTTHVPDNDVFKGSGGARNVFPMLRPAVPPAPNVAAGVLDALTREFGAPADYESLFAYVYGLLGTGAYMSVMGPFFDGSAAVAPVPLTKDLALFREVAALGGELVWLHTDGTRYCSTSGLSPAEPAVRETVPVTARPDSVAYSATDGVLHVGDGQFAPVSEEAWLFEVSGLQVVRSWLKYRSAASRGKRSSPLDDISTGRWTFSDDLCRLIATVQGTVERTPLAADLLSRVLDGPLFTLTEVHS